MVRRVGSRGDTTGTTAPRTRLLGRCGTVDRGAPQVAAVALDLHAARVLAGRRRPGSRGYTRTASLRTGAGASAAYRSPASWMTSSIVTIGDQSAPCILVVATGPRADADGAIDLQPCVWSTPSRSYSMRPYRLRVARANPGTTAAAAIMNSARRMPPPVGLDEAQQSQRTLPPVMGASALL